MSSVTSFDLALRRFEQMTQLLNRCRGTSDADATVASRSTCATTTRPVKQLATHQNRRTVVSGVASRADLRAQSQAIIEAIIANYISVSAEFELAVDHSLIAAAKGDTNSAVVAAVKTSGADQPLNALEGIVAIVEALDVQRRFCNSIKACKKAADSAFVQLSGTLTECARSLSDRRSNAPQSTQHHISFHDRSHAADVTQPLHISIADPPIVAPAQGKSTRQQPHDSPLVGSGMSVEKLLRARVAEAVTAAQDAASRLLEAYGEMHDHNTSLSKVGRITTAAFGGQNGNDSPSSAMLLLECIDRATKTQKQFVADSLAKHLQSLRRLHAHTTLLPDVPKLFETPLLLSAALQRHQKRNADDDPGQQSASGSQFGSSSINSTSRTRGRSASTHAGKLMSKMAASQDHTSLLRALAIWQSINDGCNVDAPPRFQSLRERYVPIDDASPGDRRRAGSRRRGIPADRRVYGVDPALEAASKHRQQEEQSSQKQQTLSIVVGADVREAFDTNGEGADDAMLTMPTSSDPLTVNVPGVSHREQPLFPQFASGLSDCEPSSPHNLSTVSGVLPGHDVAALMESMEVDSTSIDHSMSVIFHISQSANPAAVQRAQSAIDVTATKTGQTAGGGAALAMRRVVTAVGVARAFTTEGHGTASAVSPQLSPRASQSKGPHAAKVTLGQGRRGPLAREDPVAAFSFARRCRETLRDIFDPQVRLATLRRAAARAIQNAYRRKLLLSAAVASAKSAVESVESSERLSIISQFVVAKRAIDAALLRKRVQAALTIQRFWRSWRVCLRHRQARIDEWIPARRRDRAARVVQRWIRRQLPHRREALWVDFYHITRRRTERRALLEAVSKFVGAILLLQRIGRGVMLRLHFVREVKANYETRKHSCLAGLVKKLEARRYVSDLRRSQMVKRAAALHQSILDTCATRIQKLIRGHLSRIRVSHMRLQHAIDSRIRNCRDALVLQRCWRRVRALRRVRQLRFEREKRRQAAQLASIHKVAVVKIEGFWLMIMAMRRAHQMRLQRIISQIHEAKRQGRSVGELYRRSTGSAAFSEHRIDVLCAQTLADDARTWATNSVMARQAQRAQRFDESCIPRLQLGFDSAAGGTRGSSGGAVSDSSSSEACDEDLLTAVLRNIEKAPAPLLFVLRMLFSTQEDISNATVQPENSDHAHHRSDSVADVAREHNDSAHDGTSAEPQGCAAASQMTTLVSVVGDVIGVPPVRSVFDGSWGSTASNDELNAGTGANSAPALPLVVPVDLFGNTLNSATPDSRTQSLPAITSLPRLSFTMLPRLSHVSLRSVVGPSVGSRMAVRARDLREVRCGVTPPLAPEVRRCPRPYCTYSNAVHVLRMLKEAAVEHTWRLLFSRTDFDAYKQASLTPRSQEERRHRVEQRRRTILQCYRVDSEEEWLARAGQDIAFIGYVQYPATNGDGTADDDESIEATDSDDEVCAQRAAAAEAQFNFTHDFVCDTYPFTRRLGDVAVHALAFALKNLLRRALGCDATDDTVGVDHVDCDGPSVLEPFGSDSIELLRTIVDDQEGVPAVLATDRDAAFQRCFEVVAATLFGTAALDALQPSPPSTVSDGDVAASTTRSCSDDQ